MVERALKINYLSLIIVLFVLSFFCSPPPPPPSRSITVRCSLFSFFFCLFYFFKFISVFKNIYIYWLTMYSTCSKKKKKKKKKITHVCGGIWCILTAISAQLSVTLKHLFLSYDQRAYGAFMCNTHIYIYMPCCFAGAVGLICVCVWGGGGGGGGVVTGFD